MEKAEFFDKLKDEFTDIQVLWAGFCARTKCLYCRKKFPNGLVNKHPGETQFPLDSRFWFSGEFLFHLKDTHGFPHDIVTFFLEEIYERSLMPKL